MSSHQAKVVSIPPGAPYLPTLVEALLSGNLIEGFAPGDDPLALAGATIWVPTRRAVRALSSEFVSRLDGDAALLPSIRALGDVDDDSLFFEETGDPSLIQLEPVIGSLERHLILSRLVDTWAESLNPNQRDLYQGAEIIMPSSLSDAIWFAGDHARLMDMVATEEVDWAKLETLVPDDHAEWWQLTLQFLKIATEQWPNILAERNQQDAATLRAKMLRRQALSYEKNGSAGPVIAAGSTGSIPATADLLKTISHMENGILVLPGLDRDLDEETWRKVDMPDSDRDDSGTAPGHPQYGLKKLLSHVGVDRSSVRHIGEVDDTASAVTRTRERLISEALRPSFATGAWQAVFEEFSTETRQAAFSGVALVEARGERDEAISIALALRETLEDRSKTAALVTPDRNLARRVAVEMRRFGVPIDDSAGQPLRNRPPGTFARLVLQVAFAPADPVALISLLKHPLARFGSTPQRARHAARMFELVVLRGAIVPPVAGEYYALASMAQSACAAEKGRIHRSVRRMSPDDWKDLLWLAEELDGIFSNLKEPGNAAGSLNEFAQRTIETLEACGRDDAGGLKDLYGTEDGRALYAFLGELLDDGGMLETRPAEWPEIFDALLGHRAVRPLGGTHPRVAILGPLEARLQTFDRIVLGGLNEKTWPANARNDPFLSRPMKAALALPPPERRTGLAAHDFQVLLGMENVVLTRSGKLDNAPTVASRWVQRMLMVAGEEVAEAMKKRGRKFIDWTAAIDAPATLPRACAQPRPTPPIAVRPDSLSITEIETWIEDPYAIYAKHILKLDALDSLLREADARERGTLYHGIMEDFVREVKDPDSNDALAKLLEIARHHFDSSVVPSEQTALWWPRFETIAANFLEWHRQHQKIVVSFHPELYGKTDEGLDGFTLRGRADRIDLLRSGSLALIDYKTGSTPYPSAVKNLHAPQLPLEAAMAKRGAFGAGLAKETEELLYIRLRVDDDLKVDRIGHEQRGKNDDSADHLSEDAWKHLSALIAAYRDPNKDYRSKARLIAEKSWVSDYDHLARVREWSTGDDGEDAS